MTEFLKIAIGQLYWLDPILALDVQEALQEEAKGRAPRAVWLLKKTYTECQDRANVHAPGTLRDGWNNVLDALSEALKERQ
jgi:hypothetical protein